MGSSVRAALAGSFVLLHLSAALLTGATPYIKDRLWPVVAWYADGLCMTSTWGMFARPPPREDVRVVGERTDGSVSELTRASPQGRDLVERIRDARLRKIQLRLAKPEARGEFGAPYLEHFCARAEREGAPFVRVHLRLTAEREQTETTLMTVDCTRSPAAPVEPKEGAPSKVDE